MKYRLALQICLFVIVAASCTIDSDSTKILWEREIPSSQWGYVLPLVESRYCYFPVLYFSDGFSNRYVIFKIDLENGNTIWESEKPAINPSSIAPHRDHLGRSAVYVEEGRCEKPYKMGAYIFHPLSCGKIFVFNDSDGRLAATVMLGEDEITAWENARRHDNHIAESVPYLIWGNKDSLYGKNTDGLMRFDTRMIDFSKVPDEVQIIPPDMIWESPQRITDFSNILSEYGVIYFLARLNEWLGPELGSVWTSVLAALDVETGNIIWERSPPHISGSHFFSLILSKEKLHVIEDALSCYNKFNGNPIYENKNEDYRAYDPWSTITLYNNHLYSLENSYMFSVCADTGNRVWIAEEHPFLGALSTNLIIRQGKIYVHGYGLRIYNAANGKLISVDESYMTPGWRRIYGMLYKDIYIFTNYPKNYSNVYLTAIRCE